MFPLATSQNLTCLVVTREVLFDAILRNDIRLSALKAVLNLEAASVMMFGMISVTATGPLVRLHGEINATVYKEILKKHFALDLRTAFNQPADSCKITPRLTQQGWL